MILPMACILPRHRNSAPNSTRETIPTLPGFSYWTSDLRIYLCSTSRKQCQFWSGERLTTRVGLLSSRSTFGIDTSDILIRRQVSASSCEILGWFLMDNPDAPHQSQRLPRFSFSQASEQHMAYTYLDFKCALALSEMLDWLLVRTLHIGASDSTCCPLHPPNVYNTSGFTAV